MSDLLLPIAGTNVRIEGGLVKVGRFDLEKHVFLDSPDLVLDGLRKCQHRVDLFTFLQKPPETDLRYSYPMEWDNLAVLQVSTFDHWWTEVLDNKTRNMVRRAEKKGVVLREVPFDDDLVRGIRAIYNESPVRQRRRFRHFGMDLASVRQETGTYLDSSIFIGAYLHDKLIGFVKLVHDNPPTHASLMHILSMIQHRDKSPQNALIAHAVRACADRGIRHLLYSNFDYGTRKRDSLRDFKERNGFARTMIPRYYVPLTATGRIALRCGLHRNMVDWAPEPLAAVYRRLRTSWYARKFPGLQNT